MQSNSLIVRDLPLLLWLLLVFCWQNNSVRSFSDVITDPMVRVLHVHSGETEHESTTKPAHIYDWAVQTWKRNRIIFTTYHSLMRVVESDISVDCIYFDEAHNSVQRNFYLLRCISASMLIVAISLLRLRSTLLLLRNQG